MKELTTVAVFTLLSATLIHGLENSSGDVKPTIGGASQILQSTQPDATSANPKLLELLNRQLSIRDFVNINIRLPRELKTKMLETFSMLRLYTKDPNVQTNMDGLLSIIQIFPRSHHQPSNNQQQLQQPSNLVWGFPMPMFGGFPNAALAGLPPVAGFPNGGIAGLPPFANVSHLFAPGSNNDQMNNAAFGDSKNDHFNEDPKQDTFKASNGVEAPSTQNVAPEPEAVSPPPPPPEPASAPEPVPAPASVPVNMPAPSETPMPENTLLNKDRFRRAFTDMGNLSRAGIPFGREQANTAAVNAAARHFQFKPYIRGNAAVDTVNGAGPGGPQGIPVQVN